MNIESKGPRRDPDAVIAQHSLHSQSKRHRQCERGKITPLRMAVMRVFQPRTRRTPKRVSATVAMMANARISGGANTS